MLNWFIESQLEGERFRFHSYPVNQFFGVQSQTAEFLINQHRIADQRGAEDYLSRLGEVGRKSGQLHTLGLSEVARIDHPHRASERRTTQTERCTREHAQRDEPWR